MISFNHIWFVHFEFTQFAGERPLPICLVAHEQHTGATIMLGPDDLRNRTSTPFETGNDTLVVAYNGVDEMCCFLALGWPLPLNLADLYTEFSVVTNGKTLPCGRGLFGALVYSGLTESSYIQNESMRTLANRGAPYNSNEVQRFIEYCKSNVISTASLFRVMKDINTKYALLRGAYICSVARMEARGVPIDNDTLIRLSENWERIRQRLINSAEQDFYVLAPDGQQKYSIFEGSTFRSERFGEFLKQLRISWPRLESGSFDLSDDAFRERAKQYSIISELREIRNTLSQLRLTDLSVGRDGRNRSKINPFSSVTGRNQPSSTKFIFGNSVWLRGLIRPEEGMSLAYIDWSGQEYGIAAALSRDHQMMIDYQTGDPYLAFAKHVGLVPKNATKQTHSKERECYKVALGLGVMYGAGSLTISNMIGQPPVFAQTLMQRHREIYKQFWKWRQGAVDCAMLIGRLWTVFGWNIHIGGSTNSRSLSNFPMQANAAEMMRLACIYTTQAGISVCCPIHDALLIEGPTNSIDDIIHETRAYMAKASRDVLDEFELRTGVEVINYPSRFRDEKRGGAMWDRVMNIINSYD